MKKLSTYFSKLQRILLRKIFGFDKWHVSPLKERPYALELIAYCNRIPVRNSATEIGCGLGDILRNLNFDRRTGLDNDKKVLLAARWIAALTGKNIQYRVFTFPETPLCHQTQVLIMVNWIHHVQPATLKDFIRLYITDHVEPNGYLIVDTVEDPAYEFNHDINYLTLGLPCLVEKIGDYARGRKVWAIKKEKQ